MHPEAAMASFLVSVVGLSATSALAAAEAAPPREGDLQLEEVTVTAQRREERVQDVPISISVIGGAELDRSTAVSANEILSRIPGVSLDSGSGGVVGTSQLGVRGVVAPGSYYSGGSTVGYYVDSVPFGFVKSAAAPNANVYDLERIEVLRGPQGTLYGAGGLAGVIRVLTRDPDLDASEVKVRAIGSNTTEGGNNYRGDLAVNMPIIAGKLGARIVAGYEDWKGWIDRPTRADANDARARNLRLKVKARPTERLSIGLSGWTSRSDTGAPAAGISSALQTTTADVEPQSVDFDTYGLQAAYEFEAFSLSSSTSYIDFVTRADAGVAAPDTSLYQVQLAAKTFSQEINFASAREGIWRWTAGAIYRDGQDTQFIKATGVPYPLLAKFTSESAAVFGELTRELIDGHLEVTAGLRYFKDDVGTQELSEVSFTPVQPPLLQREVSFHATTPRVILTWKPRPNTTFYASYSEGFRSGFDQQPLFFRILPSLGPIKPDTLNNYEIGSKGRVLGGRLEFDAAVYYMDWQDVQQSLSVYLPGVVGARTIGLNGTSASGVGVDLGLTARLIEGLELSINGSWNDLSVDEEVRTFPGGGPAAGVILLNKGDRLDNSIETTVGAAIHYSFPLGNGGLTGVVSASANRSTANVFRALRGTTVVVNRGDPILTTRVSLGIDSADHWSASLFADNLNDEDGALYRAVDVTGASSGYFPRPRTVGLQVEFHY